MRRWKVALAIVGLPACVHELPVEPGMPEMFIDGPWLQGTSSEIHLEWRNARECGTDDWGCQQPVTTMSIVSLHCGGCQLLDDPSGQHFRNQTTLRAVATTDGPIQIQATLRFDATDAKQTLTASASGDHEVALQAACGLADSQTLAEELHAQKPVTGIRDCSSTRSPNDTVVIAPEIATFHGSILFPFCIGSAPPCQRPRSTISISIEPRTWGTSDAFPGFHFAMMPPLADIPSITLSTALATGERSTTTVAIPPLVPTPSPARP